MTSRYNKCSFSIDHILNVAGNVSQSANLKRLHYDWLNCTRYHPPRIQRPKRKDGVQRRNAGRNPRIPFLPSQVSILENKFQNTPYLSSHEVQQIATQLQLSDVRVKIWFQNRRARERRDQEPQNQIKIKESKSKDFRLSSGLENDSNVQHLLQKPATYEIVNKELSSEELFINSMNPKSIMNNVLPYIDKNHRKTFVSKQLAQPIKNKTKP